MQTVIDEDKLKQVLKEAIIEMLEERKNLFHDLIIEAMEDIALTNAIREGESTESVSKKEIFNILEGNA
jgi:Asp-tRNA(Asn)/Glu-tRNA(Gln) amidotransferase C subunit